MGFVLFVSIQFLTVNDKWFLPKFVLFDETFFQLGTLEEKTEIYW